MKKLLFFILVFFSLQNAFAFGLAEGSMPGKHQKNDNITEKDFGSPARTEVSFAAIGHGSNGEAATTVSGWIAGLFSRILAGFLSVFVPETGDVAGKWYKEADLTNNCYKI